MFFPLKKKKKKHGSVIPVEALYFELGLFEVPAISKEDQIPLD